MKVNLLVLLFAPFLAVAQVLRPGEFLGYEVGDRFTRHYRVVDYYRHVATFSDRVVIEEYGRTYEDRPLVLAFVSTEENIGRLEQIRMDNLRRAGLLEGSPATRVNIVWLSYGVHGNESSSTEASMVTLYELIRADADRDEWLEDIVVVMDPCLNPDGRERYVNFFWENASQPYNPDPHALEHIERLPGGRANHYLYDLNRDWAWQTQVESQRRGVVYGRWLPHVHVDFHEQGVHAPYYFAPAAQPYHELITSFQRGFQEEMGRNHARYFDEQGWLYFTKEVFDLLYPSYGDTYPMYNGAIGMTYEQAGHSRAGLGVIKREGDTLTLGDRVAHHLATGLSTVEVVATHSSDVLLAFSRFFGDQPELRYKTFVLKYDGNRDKFNALGRWLSAQDIRYGTAAVGTKGLRGYDYSTGINTIFSIAKNDMVISMDQPKARLAHILFEPQVKLVDSISYDLTAWGVPYIYGIGQAYASEQSVSVSAMEERPFSAQAKPDKTYAFVSKWNSMEDARFLAALLRQNVKVRFTEKRISYKRRVFDRGSPIITRLDNRAMKGFEGAIVDLANAYERDLAPLHTGFMDDVPDIGSGSVRYLRPPKIAVLKGEGVSSLSFGAVWHFMEQELNYPITILGANYLSSVDLSVYDVLVMPDGRYDRYGGGEMKGIMEWVSQGGKLIVIQRALEKFKDSDYCTLSSYVSEDSKKDVERVHARRREGARLTRYEDMEREAAKDLSQAIFKVHLDNSHPLAFGYGDVYYTLKTVPHRVAYLGEGNVGIIQSEKDLMSGFAGQHVREDIAETLALGVERKGRGHLVYFVDDPLFRSFWQNGKLLFVNALFYVGQ